MNVAVRGSPASEGDVVGFDAGPNGDTENANEIAGSGRESIHRERQIDSIDTIT